MDEKAILKPMLSVKGLTKYFGNTLILDNISLDVNPGEIISIIGKSGVGKSTLFRCITLLEKINKGSLYFDSQCYAKDQDILFQPWEIRRNIILVFQRFNLFPNMTVLENIASPLRNIKKITRRDSRDIAYEQAKRLNISDCINRYPEAISGGQAQRCALARAMVLEPKVLLLDEITSALDPESILTMIDAIQCLKDTEKTGDMAILLNTHLMQFASTFSDRIIFIHDGKVHEEHTASEFMMNCQKEETKKFVTPFLKVL